MALLCLLAKIFGCLYLLILSNDSSSTASIGCLYLLILSNDSSSTASISSLNIILRLNENRIFVFKL